MNLLIQFKKLASTFFIALMLACFGVASLVYAVVPPPDGAYPGFNTAEGQNALFSLSTGAANTAVGWYSLFSDTTGSFNTATGAGALLFNTADQNTAFGAAALLFNTTGSANTASGAAALLNNLDGLENTAVGASALSIHATGNTNTAIGAFALSSDTSGLENTAVGDRALLLSTTGGFNTAIGQAAMLNNDSGSSNVAIGVQALGNNTSGSGNIVLGNVAGSGITTADDVICIGAGGENVDGGCYIGGIFNGTSSGGSAVFINSAGKLGTSTSSKRFKNEIKPMEQASEALYALKPVSFHYKKEIDPRGTKQFGLLAEDVEKVNPDLVVRDKEGKSYSVRYDQVNAMLLNEFLKEHHKVEKLEAALTAVTEHLKEQDSKIQKVSVQVELSKPAAQTVNNQR
jgi:hypothetical protein